MDRLLWWFGRGTIVIALSGGMLVGCSDDEDEPMQTQPATMDDGASDSASSAAPEDGQSNTAGQDANGGASGAPAAPAGGGAAGGGAAGAGGAAAGAGGAAVDPAACMATVPAEVDMACATCACEMGPEAISACDADCWELINCVSTNCPNSQDIACILGACSGAGGPAGLTAMPAGAVLTACNCGTDAGSTGGDGGVGDSGGPVDPATCMASVPPEVDVACATCACETNAAAVTACGVDCWTLIDCSVVNDCGSDINCLSEFCSDSLVTGGAAAEPVGTILTECGCGEGDDAGVSGN